MSLGALEDAAERYRRDGFVSPVDVLSADQAARHLATAGTV